MLLPEFRHFFFFFFKLRCRFLLERGMFHSTSALLINTLKLKLIRKNDLEPEDCTRPRWILTGTLFP